MARREGKTRFRAETKEQLDHAQDRAGTGATQGDLARAGEIAYGIIPDLTRKLSEAEAQQGPAMINEAVTEQDIAGVVSRWTGIPVDRMLEGERAKLLHMEESIRARVIGQEEAVVAVSNAVRRARAGFRIPIGRSAPSCSLDLRAWARRS